MSDKSPTGIRAAQHAAKDKVAGPGKQEKTKLKKQASSQGSKVHAGDFLVGCLLGEGAYARVHYVKLKVNKNEYAMKVMEKKFILKEEKTHFVSMEKRCLSSLNHPNIMKLYYSFHDSTHLYMVIDLCRGGELKHTIEHFRDENVSKGVRDRALPSESARFYTAEIVHGVQYLHSKGIIHRDLKPENILLSADGHVKITDFGTAKDEKVPNNHPNTFCGTAEYVSPEVLNDREPSVGADLWAIGCIVFQSLVGRPPFRDENEYLTFQRILNHPKDPLEYPKWMDPITVDLINHLLVRDPLKRIGSAMDRTPYRKDEPERSRSTASSGTILSQLSDDDIVSDEDKDANDEGMVDFVETVITDNGPEKLREHAYFAGVDFGKLGSQKPPKLVSSSSLPEPTIDGSSKMWMMADDAHDLKEFATAVDLNAPRAQPREAYMRSTLTRASFSGDTGNLQDDESSVLSNFLSSNERVILDGLVSKRRGLFSQTRHLVLTSRPRLFYIDPVKLILKGEIPWSNMESEMLVVAKPNEKSFDIQVKNRTYHLTVLVGKAASWEKAITTWQKKGRKAK